MNKDEIMQVIAKTTAAIIALQTIAAGINEQNTKHDPYVKYIHNVIVEAIAREREKQTKAGIMFAETIKQDKGELS